MPTYKLPRLKALARKSNNEDINLSITTTLSESSAISADEADWYAGIHFSPLVLPRERIRELKRKYLPSRMVGVEDVAWGQKGKGKRKQGGKLRKLGQYFTDSEAGEE
jgi:hypothetical protein